MTQDSFEAFLIRVKEVVTDNEQRNEVMRAVLSTVKDKEQLKSLLGVTEELLAKSRAALESNPAAYLKVTHNHPTTKS